MMVMTTHTTPCFDDDDDNTHTPHPSLMMMMTTRTTPFFDDDADGDDGNTHHVRLL